MNRLNPWIKKKKTLFFQSGPFAGLNLQGYEMERWVEAMVWLLGSLACLTEYLTFPLLHDSSCTGKEYYVIDLFIRTAESTEKQEKHCWEWHFNSIFYAEAVKLDAERHRHLLVKYVNRIIRLRGSIAALINGNMFFSLQLN